MANLNRIEIDTRKGTVIIVGDENFINKWMDDPDIRAILRNKPKPGLDMSVSAEQPVSAEEQEERGKRLWEFRELIRTLQKEQGRGGAAELAMIIAECEKTGLDREEVLDLIQKLKSAGEIIESGDHCYRVV